MDADGDDVPDCVDPDDDNDFVADGVDVCPDSVLGDADRAAEFKKNRYYADVDGVFVDLDGADSGYSTADTGGCSAAQIIEAAGLGTGHQRFGITQSALIDWIASLG